MSIYIYTYAYRCFGLCMVHFHKSQRATQLTPICVYIHAHIHICLHANIGPQRKTNYFTKNKKQQFHQSQLATQLIPICIYIYTHISTCKHMPKKKAQLFHSKKKNNNFSKSACYPLIDVAFITSNFFVKQLCWKLYVLGLTTYNNEYWVATISRLLKIIGLFGRILSLLQVSLAKENYHFKEPTNQRTIILRSLLMCTPPLARACARCS